MKRALALLILSIIVGSTFASAQAPAKPELPKEATVAATDADKLALEKLGLKQQLEYVIAQRDICEGKLAGTTYQEAMAGLEQERQALIAAFEKSHPGYTLDTKTGEAVKKPDDKKPIK